MTIGPAPMIMIERMSVLFGMGALRDRPAAGAGDRGRGFARGRQIAVVIEADGGGARRFPARGGGRRWPASEDQVGAAEVGVRVEADGEVGGAVAVEVGGRRPAS